MTETVSTESDRVVESEDSTGEECYWQGYVVLLSFRLVPTGIFLHYVSKGLFYIDGQKSYSHETKIQKHNRKVY